MKVRGGFVTNSSSSSYLVLYKVNDIKQLEEYVAKRFGEFGIEFLPEMIAKRNDIKKLLHGDFDTVAEEVGEDLPEDLEGDEFLEAVMQRMGIDTNPDTTYMYMDVISDGSTDDSNPDYIAIFNGIPDKYRTKIYEQPDYGW